MPRRLGLRLLARPRPGSAEARPAVAHRGLQGLVEEVQLLADALLPHRFHRVVLVCSLAQRFSPSHLPHRSGATMASADSSAAIECRRRHPSPVVRRAEEASHGKTLHFPGVAAGSTSACDGRSIGRPRLSPGCPTRTGLVSDFCSSAPRFASGFLPTPHRCDAVALGYRFRSLRPEEDFHLQVLCPAWHTIDPGLRRDEDLLITRPCCRTCKPTECG